MRQLRRQRRPTTDEPVFQLTSAPPSRPDEIRARTRSYLLKMGVRTVCFVLAIVIPYPPARIALLVAAIVLPWISVVSANGGPRRGSRPLEVYRPEQHRALGPGPDPGP